MEDAPCSASSVRPDDGKVAAGGDPSGNEAAPVPVTPETTGKLDDVSGETVDGAQALTGSAAGEDQSKLFESDYFRMHCMKVLPCNKGYRHDWTVCPYVHDKEKARRRPLSCNYTGIACPEMKKFAEATERMGTRTGSIRAGTAVSDSVCPRGDVCPYAHNVLEYWLHPTRYRTQMCNDGSRCNRNICFFAHCPEQIRVPKVKPFVSPEMLAQATLDAQRKKAAQAKDQQATLQNWVEMMLGSQSAPQGPLSVAHLAQIAAYQARAQAGATRAPAQDVRQMQLLMEVLQQASNPQPALQPSLQAAMLHAGLSSLDDRQGLDPAYRSASEPRGFGRQGTDFARTLSAAQMQGLHADFRTATNPLGMSGNDLRSQFRAQLSGAPVSAPHLGGFSNVGNQGLDLSSLGNFNLGGSGSLSSPTRASFDFLPQSNQQPPSPYHPFGDSLGMPQSRFSPDALNISEGTPRNSFGGGVGPEWDTYRGLGSPHHDMLPQMDYNAGGDQGMNANVAMHRSSLDSGNSSHSRRTSQESSRSNTSYHDAASRVDELNMRRLSVDSYAPSRMSMDSNASYMLGGDPNKVGTPNLNADGTRLSMEESLQRMSLDHSHYSGSLGHQPLETVAERQELEARLYSGEGLPNHNQGGSQGVNSDAAYRTALNSSFFGSSTGNNTFWPLQQYRSTADSSPYANSNVGAADWKMTAADLGRQNSRNNQLPPRIPSPSAGNMQGLSSEDLWHNIRNGQQ